jgi:hypothetical protein
MPRKIFDPRVRDSFSQQRGGPGQDRRRHIEAKRHHPQDHLEPHPPHVWFCTNCKHGNPLHHPHNRPDYDLMGPHLNPPSPIKPAKTITRTGTRR